MIKTGLPLNPYASLETPFDYRGFNLSDRDLRQAITELKQTTFDSRTQWPAQEYLPAGFDPKQVFAYGTDPGLGVSELHERGIRGQGISIAIVDAPLNLEHIEYRDRIRMYERSHVGEQEAGEMHASAVVSIAVGRTVGVAPDADLYYIASRTGDHLESGEWKWDFDYYAEAVERMLAVNASLPPSRKIRVLAMQIGFSAERADLTRITQAIQAAQAQGIFVICTTLEDLYGFRFNGLGRDPLADPELFESYLPGHWWEDDFYTGEHDPDELLFPMDARSFADPNSEEGYVFYRYGGWSWVTAYIAGLYALAAQVDATITPARFWELAVETGRSVEIEQAGSTHALEKIVDPVRLIESIERGLSDEQ